jgi:hypothetical protein
MPDGIGETLTTRLGPLPVWVWTGVGVAGLGYYLYRRRASQAATAQAASTQGVGSSSNLGTVPISNLTTAAQPMPIQMGDTFVNVSDPTSQQTSVTGSPVNVTTNPVTPPATPAAQIDKSTGLTHISNPAQSQGLQQQGYNIYTMLGGQWYNPAQPVKAGTALDYVRITDPQQSKWLGARGCKIITLGNTQFYQYGQCTAANSAGMPK